MKPSFWKLPLYFTLTYLFSIFIFIAVFQYFFSIQGNSEYYVYSYLEYMNLSFSVVKIFHLILVHLFSHIPDIILILSVSTIAFYYYRINIITSANLNGTICIAIVIAFIATIVDYYIRIYLGGVLSGFIINCLIYLWVGVSTFGGITFLERDKSESSKRFLAESINKIHLYLFILLFVFLLTLFAINIQIYLFDYDIGYNFKLDLSIIGFNFGLFAILITIGYFLLRKRFTIPVETLQLSLLFSSVAISFIIMVVVNIVVVFLVFYVFHFIENNIYLSFDARTVFITVYFVVVFVIQCILAFMIVRLIASAFFYTKMVNKPEPSEKEHI